MLCGFSYCGFLMFKEKINRALKAFTNNTTFKNMGFI